jgi:hypothetical protein
MSLMLISVHFVSKFGFRFFFGVRGYGLLLQGLLLMRVGLGLGLVGVSFISRGV